MLLLWPIPRGESARPRSEGPVRPRAHAVLPGRATDRSPCPVTNRSRKSRGYDRNRRNSPHSALPNSLRSFSTACGARRRHSISMPSRICTPCSSPLAQRKLVVSARDISDGGIAVAAVAGDLRQRYWRHYRAGPLAHDPPPLRPLCGTGFDHADQHSIPNQAAIEKISQELNFFVARIGTTGGGRLEISVDGEPFISASVEELRTPWATALEATLHGEVLG